MKKIVKVITASVLTVSMCGCAVSADEAKSTATADTVSADKKSSKKDASEAYTSQQTGKDETVYVFTGADGSMNHMVVSDTLHTAGKKGAVEDYSNLDNIENVSGDEKYSSDDNGNITWTSDGSDISYQGTTDKELPVDVKITYYLNGNEVSPEEIKGQSGHVKVHFDYTNNAETTITSNGEEKTVKVPFGMVTGLTLDASKFTNVTVTNGKMNQYNDSDVIYGLALPGLKESLETASVSDIDLTSVNIPEYFEFEADTTDFDIDLCMTIATSNLLSLLNTDDLNVSDFSGSIDQLTSSGQKLVDGTKSLKDGTSQLKSGADSLDSGAQSLVNGIGTLNDGASSLNDGAASLASGAQSLNDGAKSVNDGAASLASGAQSLASGASQLDSGAASALSGAQQLESGLATISGSSSALNSGYQDLADGIFRMVDTVLHSKGLISKDTILAEDNYVGIFSNLTGVNDEMRNTALQTVASTADVDTDTAKYLIIMSAKTYGSENALKAENLTAVGNQLKEQSAPALAIAAKVSAAKTSAAKEPYINDAAVANILNGIVEQNAYVDNNYVNDDTRKAAYKAAYDSVVKQVAAVAQMAGVPDAETLAPVIAVYACENYATLNGDTLIKKCTAAVTEMNNANSVSELITNTIAANQELLNGILTAAVKSNSDYSDLSGLLDVLNGVEKFKGNLSLYTGSVDSAYAGAKKLVDGLSSLSAGADQLNSGAQTLLSGSNTLTAGTQTLYNGTGSLLTGSNSLRDGAAELFSGVGKVKAGAQTLKNGTSSLKTGVATLDDGAATLESGMEQFYEEGIKKIGDVLGKDLPAVVDSLKGLTNAGADYKTFSGALDDNNNSCKFIFKTEFDSDNK